MKRKIIVGDQVIGGAPPPETEPEIALPTGHPHAAGSYRALCFCGHTGQVHAGNPNNTTCLDCSCPQYQRREYIPVPIAVQGTSAHPVMSSFEASAGPWLAISAPSVPPEQTVWQSFGQHLNADSRDQHGFFCEHANESPATCPCGPDCSCRIDTGGPCRTAQSNRLNPSVISPRARPQSPEEASSPNTGWLWNSMRRLLSGRA